MSGSLILLPLRLSLRATALAARAAREMVQRAASLAGLVADEPPLPDFHAAPDDPPPGVDLPPRPTQTQTAAPSHPGVAGDGTHADRGQPVDEDAPADLGHVDTDDELVEDVAEPGAEDGAGAQVRIAEPWAGYQALRAVDVTRRLATASPEELAAVELYELANRKRRTVITAAQRQLRRRR